MKNVIYRHLLFALFTVMLTMIPNQAKAVDPIVDSLFIIASSGEVMHQEAREPAMDSIATYGEAVVGFLIGKLNVVSRQEKWTAIWILERIGAPSVSYLVEALRLKDGKHVQRICWALSKVGDSSAVEGLIGVRQHARWQVREEALGALSKIKDNRADATVLEALVDTIGQVRKGAAVACGNLLSSGGSELLIGLLDDNFYGARMSAFEALTKFDSTLVTTQVSDRIRTMTPLAQNLACQLLGKLGTDQALAQLFGLAGFGDERLRSYVALAIITADPTDRIGYQERLMTAETDRLNLLKLESAINAGRDELEEASE